MFLPKELAKKLDDLFSYYPDCNGFSGLFSERAKKGIRVNTLKCSVEEFSKFNIGTAPSPFCKEGFYVDSGEKLGNHPLHHAGAFYVQEPSATSAVTVLNPSEGDYVLDLCAAPGGKSTQIAALLNNTGLIWANEIVKSRANILLSNFERMGVARGVVSNCHPDTLCEALDGCFDKVLVDAPCSGEGMMRKDPSIADEWTAENVISCAARQQKILDSASLALRDGGILVYSTCTYSREENEENIEIFLRNHPEFILLDIDVPFGRRGINLKQTRRILWTDGGEGHFVAKLKKSGEGPRRNIAAATLKASKSRNANKEMPPAEVCEFLKNCNIKLPAGEIALKNDKLYLLPEKNLPSNVGVIRGGLLLGEIARGRFTPAHALFATPFVKTENCIDLRLSDPRLAKFLHGEEIEARGNKGFNRVSVEGIPLGFGKLSDGRLKNYYPKGLRTL